MRANKKKKTKKKREKGEESERNKRRTCDLRRSSRTKLDIRIFSGAKEEDDDASSSSSNRQQNSEGDERKWKHRCRKQEERNAALSTFLCYQSGGRVRFGERTSHLIMSPS